MNDTTPLDYQELRNISPQAARQAILQILKANKGNVSQTARMLGITRKTVYKAMAKREAGNLDDGSRAPKVVHNKTPAEVEQKVVMLKKKTNYGPLRLKEELEAVYKISLSEHTIRNIVRRNKDSIKNKKHKPHKKGPRPFVDWYSAKPFEVVQVDLKYVVDQKALSLSIAGRCLPPIVGSCLPPHSRVSVYHHKKYNQDLARSKASFLRESWR